VHYLSPSKQRSLRFASMDFVPWNHFGRKNIGYLYALAHGAEVVYDTDDDNILKMPLEEVMRYTRPEQDAYILNTKIVATNVYPLFTSNFSWPRGFPLSLINDDAVGVVDAVGDMKKVGVIQSLADNDPDVDAIYRLTRPLPLNFDQVVDLDVVRLPQGTFTPFNAQATIFKRDALWALLLPVTVHGRVSDIWRSYMVQRILWDADQVVAFTTPWVKQCRNVHSYLADFSAEGPLYEQTEALINFLVKWKPRSKTVPGRLLEVVVEMFERGFLEEEDVFLTRAWIRDLRNVGYRFPELVVETVQKAGPLGRLVRTDPRCEIGVELDDECLPHVVNNSFYTQKNLFRNTGPGDVPTFSQYTFIFLDSHKAPQLDSLSSVAEELGVPPENMGTVCALNYCHLNEHVRRRYAHLVPPNEREAKRFVRRTYEGGVPVRPGETFDSFVRSFDVIVCTFPTWHCESFLDGRTAIVLRFSHSPWHRMKGDRRAAWARRLARLMDDPRVVISSNNPYHYTMFKNIAGRFPVPWPATYAHVRAPRRPDPHRWVAEVGAPYSAARKSLFMSLAPELNVTSFHSMVEPADRRGEIAVALVFPYAAHTGKITELYAMGVPLLLPSLELVQKLQREESNFMDHRDPLPRGWTDEQFCAHDLVAGKGVDTGLAAESLGAWYMYTEFYQWPHVHYYDSMEPVALINRVRALLDDEAALAASSRAAVAFFDKVRRTTRTELKLKLHRAIMTREN
jgi:hypothetical protein